MNTTATLSVTTCGPYVGVMVNTTDRVWWSPCRGAADGGHRVAGSWAVWCPRPPGVDRFRRGAEGATAGDDRGQRPRPGDRAKAAHEGGDRVAEGVHGVAQRRAGGLGSAQQRVSQLRQAG